MRLLLVCLGGALGAGSRYLVTLALVRGPGPSLPWATLAVNVLGCFLLELLVGVIAGGLRISEELRLLLATGVLGGFTTYSSFNTEVLGLWRAGAARTAALYLLLTLLGCLVSGLAGAAAGRALAGAPHAS